MKEEWRDIVGYEGLYQVSNLGRVRSLKRTTKRFNGFKVCEFKDGNKILKLTRNNKGYLTVGLCKEGKEKKYKVHRLVAETFIPNPNKLPEVNHKNEFEKENNNIDNLEWCATKYNSNYGTRGKRIASKLGKKIRCLETGITYNSIKEAARKTGIAYCGIAYCCQGKYKQIKGTHWNYEDTV